jgi:hypothetical protein
VLLALAFKEMIALLYVTPAVAGLSLCLSRGWRMWSSFAVGVPLAYGIVASIILALERRAADTVPCSEASDCSEGIGGLIFVVGPIVVWCVAAALSAAVLGLKQSQRRKRASDDDSRAVSP